MKQIKPMAAVSVPKGKTDQYLDDPNYVGEQKFDGSRYILQKGQDGIYLTSRRESVEGGMVNKTENVIHIINEANDSFAFKEIILDGEIDIDNDNRHFKYVQSVMGSLPERALELQKEKGYLVYRVFDILEYNGEDLRVKPLLERRRILEQLFTTTDFKYLKLTPQFKDKRKLLEEELAKGNEGIMIKNINAIYVEDKGPTKTWFKIKPFWTYDGIVKGYQLGEGKYTGMVGALIVWQYLNGELIQSAEVSGMTDVQRVQFKEKLDKGETFIIEFKSEALFESTHKYRFPTFVRVRTDKSEKDCKYGKG